MSAINFDRFMHVGVVVHNIEDALEKMQKAYKISRYRINQFPPEDDSVKLMYHGKTGHFSARFCFIQMGVSEIELIEPGGGESVWHDFLKEHGEGIHHLKFEVDSLNETISEFKKCGIPCIQYGSAVGPNAGKIWAYFDTTESLGYITEVLNTEPGELPSI